MGQEIFIRIDGIAGESTDAVHKNEIDVKSWHWLATRRSAITPHLGLGKEGIEIMDLAFTHDVDRSSPNIIKYCLTEKKISEIILSIRKSGVTSCEYLKITLNDARITRIQPSCSNLDQTAQEEVHLSFSKITQEYTLQNDQGRSAGTITASFDLRSRGN
jgi:type VI secretion system secreted protein Hcp